MQEGTQAPPGLADSLTTEPVLQANELLFGRFSMLGLSAALIGELMTGQGPLAQMGLETGVSSIFDVNKAVLLV